MPKDCKIVCKIVDNLADLVESVFGTFLTFPENMILCTTNKKCTTTNEFVLRMLPETPKEYIACNEVVDDIDIDNQLLDQM